MKKAFIIAGCALALIAVTAACASIIVGTFTRSSDPAVEVQQNNTTPSYTGNYWEQKLAELEAKTATTTTTTTRYSGNYWDQVVADFEAKKTTTTVRNTPTTATRTMADDFNDYILPWLLLILGFAIIAFLHLFVPILVAAWYSDRKPLKPYAVLLIAAIGGVVGFFITGLSAVELRGTAGLIQSAFWTMVCFLILKKKGFVEKTSVFCPRCKNKVRRNATFCDRCGAEIYRENDE